MLLFPSHHAGNVAKYAVDAGDSDENELRRQIGFFIDDDDDDHNDGSGSRK